MLLRHPCRKLCNTLNLNRLHFSDSFHLHQLLYSNVMQGVELAVLFKPVKELLCNR